MKRIIILFSCIASALTMAGCNQDDRSKYERVPIPEELRQAFLFNKGTYWIYTGVHSGTVDSVYIQEGDPELVYDDENRLVYEKIQRSAIIVRVVGVPGSNKFGNHNADLRGSSFAGCAWPLGSGYHETPFNVPTAEIQGNLFNQATLVVDNQDSTLLKEKVGLIRYASNVAGEPVHQVYELVRYHINQ